MEIGLRLRLRLGLRRLLSRPRELCGLRVWCGILSRGMNRCQQGRMEEIVTCNLVTSHVLKTLCSAQTPLLLATINHGTTKRLLISSTVVSPSCFPTLEHVREGLNKE